jgi:hypothetical protein
VRSNPSPEVLAFFDRVTETLVTAGQPFGVFEVLAKMDEEAFFPCNPMQVECVFRPRIAERMTREGWTPSEEADSGNEMVGRYQKFERPVEVTHAVPG